MMTKREVAILIERLVRYGIQHKLTHPLDVLFVRNALLDLFQLPEPATELVPEQPLLDVQAILDPLLDYGAQIGLLPDQTMTQRDLLDARIMGMLMSRPAETVARFQQLAAQDGIEAATADFYAQNVASNYIHGRRIADNEHWTYETVYGTLQLSINVTKPEKEPGEIAKLKTMVKSDYPKCLLCIENVGYAGRIDHPARQNLRTIPITLIGEPWNFQYSPYVYYNEHSIVFRQQHWPMQITEATFARLLDFVEQFPHYFVGSNADLPIVGGSILNHDHFQAGKHTFPMDTAATIATYTSTEFANVTFSTLAWPVSVVRLRGATKQDVLRAASHMLQWWRKYNDPSVHIVAMTERNGELVPHNTITPIARLTAGGVFELDLVLRNNRTNDDYPSGIFHPHPHLHHLKRENMGLIEVMGLAVLPGRLKAELAHIRTYLCGGQQVELPHHADWVASLVEQYGTSLTPEQATQVLQTAVGQKYNEMLQIAGVFKQNEAGQAAFVRFLNGAGIH